MSAILKLRIGGDIMNIKKLLLTSGAAFIMLGAANAYAAEKVIIPDYECIINDSAVYYADSEYPLISYRDVTYFPMTYDYCRALNLASSWVDGKGLFIAYVPFGTYDALPVYPTVSNTKVNEAVLPEYPIYINGKKIDNSKEDYPLLNFRGVTYFPMTYDYATKEFNWQTNWQTGRFSLSTNPDWAGVAISVEETHPDYAVIGYHEDHPIHNPDGSVSSGETTSTYKKLNYKTGEMTVLTDYKAPKQTGDYKSVELKIDKENKKVYYNDSLLPEVKSCFEQNESDYKTAEISVKAGIHKVGGVEFLEVEDFFTGWKEDGSGSGTRMQSLYLLDDGKPVFIGNWFMIENAETLGENKYFSLRQYGQTVFMHPFSSQELYKYSGGKLTNVTETFSDYGSVALLGKADGKLYLKCEWCPERMGESAYHNVSPVNDGYFTYDGENLTKVANFVYTDHDLFGEGGEIYGVTDWNASVIKIK